MKNYKESIAKEIEKLDIGLDYEKIYNLIELPKTNDMGDFAFPCFSLAKTMRKNPSLIAEDIANKLSIEGIDKIENVNAYVNFFVDRKEVYNQVLNEIIEKKQDYGKSDMGNGINELVEFSSVNIAKPFHIGHIRSTVIGDVIRNIYEYLGYNVIATNYIGDYGTQFGVMIAAYKLWGDKEKIDADPINELLNLYVRYTRESEDNEEYQERARQEFKNLEDGEEEATTLWQWFKDISLREFDRVYSMLDIKYDNYNGEAYSSQFMPAAIEELKEKNLLVESDGALMVDLSDYDLPPSMLIKSNGSSAYITRDVATALHRHETYDLDKNIYVVGSQQKLHFQQLKAILSKMGHKDVSEEVNHVQFGMVSLKDQVLSTRRGHVVFLEDVLNKAIEKTRSIMEDRDNDLEDLDQAAKIVGIGAVKFQELYNSRIKDYIFDWDELLNFEGETGPYVHYTYARAKSVLRKAGKEEFEKMDFSELNTEEEYSLIKSLESFQQAIIQAMNRLEPAVVARKVMEIAQNFNKVYNSTQILVDDEKLKEERLALTYATSIVIKNGLGILGIKTVEQM
ncbi:MAG: arginine--tRNA ligase [Peptoniphilaceae bacterium]|nr:arginine--tRNA ligase [Peptoniphilaceae bacterium]MDY6018459.1 arginine--tRNA ligase [Anaerococcus sp.]